MTANPLDIDPKNMGFDFGKEWLRFTETRIHAFVVLWLKRSLRSVHTCLETATGNEISLFQGRAAQIRQLLLLLESKNVDGQLKEVLNYIENYGK